MARKPNKFREIIEYIPVKLILAMAYLLGPRIMLILARPISYMGYLIDFPHRSLAAKQVAACMPELSARQRRRTVRGAFLAAAQMAIESLFLKRVITPENFHQHVSTPGRENWQPHLDSPGRGAIMATGHFGNWELGQAIMSTLGYEGLTIVKPIANRYINARLSDIRSWPGMSMADKKGAFQSSIRAVRGGKLLLIAADMYAGRGGLRVDFFGYDASCHRSMALLAVRYKVPLLIGFVRRDTGFFRFTLEMPLVITPEDWSDKEDPIHWITLQYNLAVEKMVRKTPEQFFGWLHRRWRGKEAPWLQKSNNQKPTTSTRRESLSKT